MGWSTIVRNIYTYAPLYSGGAGIVIARVCSCVRKTTHERVDACRPNLVDMGKG